MHTSQAVGHAAWFAQDSHEQGSSARVAAEPLVDTVTVVAYQTNGRRAHALQLRVRCRVTNTSSSASGLVGKQVVAYDLQEPVARLEEVVDGYRARVSPRRRDELLEQCRSAFR